MESIIQTSRNPDLTFYNKGRIDISANLVHQLGMENGDIIDIAYAGADLYIYIKYKANAVVGRHKCRVNSTNGFKGMYRLWCKEMTDAMFNICNSSSNVLRLPCGVPTNKENKLVVPIIYKNKL